LTRSERSQVRAIERDSQKDGYLETDDAEYDVNETLLDILDAHSLTGCYFGSHPGDGADFGWWVSEGYIEEFDGLKVDDTSEVPSNFSGEVLHVNDHGNVTLYIANRGKLSEIWSLV